MTEQKAEYKTVTFNRKPTREVNPNESRVRFTRERNPAAFAIWDAGSRKLGESFPAFCRREFEGFCIQKLADDDIGLPEPTEVKVNQDKPPKDTGNQDEVSPEELFKEFD